MRGSVNDLPVVVDIPLTKIQQIEWGGMTVSLEQHKTTFNLAPLFQGLPDDRCQSPHWGYVIKGSIKYNFADRVEIFNEGDVYFAAAGHIPEMQEGAIVVEFSPTELLEQTMEVANRNAAKMMGQ